MIRALKVVVMAARELNEQGSTLPPSDALEIVELLEAIDRLLEGL